MPDGGVTLGELPLAPPRTELVVDAIERAILAGELRAGERLVERNLAARLGVSKTPVREALKVLASRGLVVSQPYRGTAVRAIDADTARKLYDVRLLLEPAAVRQATDARGAGPLEEARRPLAEAAAAGRRGDLAELALANRRFHRALYAGGPNGLLCALLDGIQDQVAMISVSGWRRRSSWRAEADEHEALLEAVEQGDGALAHDRAQAHIGRFLSEALESGPATTTE